MKLATAPTLRLPRRRAAISAPASKSFVWMRTGISASRHRWEERDFVARLHRRRRLRHFLVDGNPQRLSLGERRLPATAAGHEQRAQPRDRGRRGRDFDVFPGLAQLLAQARQIENLDLHRYNSEYGMNFTMSPARIGCSAGLSTRPSAHAVDISTAESCVGYKSSPPRAFHFTRRYSRRGSGSGQSKSARTAIAWGCTSAIPCVLSRNGRTNIKNVTKLDTGFPGNPRNAAFPTLPDPPSRWMCPKASGRPGFIAIFHMSSSPSASTAGFTKSASPTETPPLVTITSHSAAARRSISRVASSESATMP